MNKSIGNRYYLCFHPKGICGECGWVGRTPFRTIPVPNPYYNKDNKVLTACLDPGIRVCDLEGLSIKGI